MKLSAPVYSLKRKARILSRQENLPLHAALDRVASQEGFRNWSLLAAKAPALTQPAAIYARLAPGDLVVVGARPGQGKTLMSLRLAVEAMNAGNHSMLFTLEYTAKQVLDRFRAIGVDLSDFQRLFEYDTSDAMSAEYMIDKLAASPPGTLVVVDYLQILDQKRQHPDLTDQIAELKSFAADRGFIFIFISQIRRSYDPSVQPFPTLGDIRLPNPLDLRLFSKAVFLNDGATQFRTVP